MTTSDASVVNLSASMSDSEKQRVLKIAVWCGLAGFFLASVASPPADLDMWHQMALIRESIAAGHLLTADRFAYTPTINPSVHHEWGAGAVLYALASIAGAWPIVALKYVLAVVTAAIVILCARLRKAGFAEMSVLAPLIFPLYSLGRSTLRAQAYTFLFLAILLYCLEIDLRGNRRWIPFWAAAFVVWTNLHGGCVIGIAVLCLYWIEQFVRRRPHIHLLGAAALSLAAMAVNPFGLSYYPHQWNALRMPRPEIMEWWPIWRTPPWQGALFLVTVGIAIYVILVRGLRASPGAPILAAMAIGSVIHVRMLPPYALVWAAFVPSYASGTPLGGLIGKLFRKRELVTLVCVVLTMFSTVSLIAIPCWALTVPNDRFPVGAVRYLAELEFHGNVMTPFNQGSYVTWRLFPAVRVSLDSRYEAAYPAAVSDESFRFYKAERDWRQTLAKYSTDLVLTPRKAAVAAALRRTDWKLVYVDKSFEIFARPGLHIPLRDHRAEDFPGSFP